MDFSGTYFENNVVDLFAAPDTNMEGSFDYFQSARGRFGNAVFQKCSLADASLVTAISGAQLVSGCQLTGEFTREDKSRVVYTDATGTLVKRIWIEASSGVEHNFYELTSTDVDSSLYLRAEGPFDINGLRLENSRAANASGNMPSASIQLRGSKWTGSPTTFSWRVNAEAAAANGSPETTSGIYFRPDAGREFGFREGGVLQLTQMQAKSAALAATVLAAAGSGASCTLETGLGVSDMAGQMTLTTGTGSWGTGAQCRVTFASTLNGWVTITPANVAAAAAMNARQVFVERGENRFELSFGAADTAQNTYKFNWHAIGNY